MIKDEDERFLQFLKHLSEDLLREQFHNDLPRGTRTHDTGMDTTGFQTAGQRNNGHSGGTGGEGRLVGDSEIRDGGRFVPREADTIASIDNVLYNLTRAIHNGGQNAAVVDLREDKHTENPALQALQIDQFRLHNLLADLNLTETVDKIYAPVFRGEMGNREAALQFRPILAERLGVTDPEALQPEATWALLYILRRHGTHVTEEERVTINLANGWTEERLAKGLEAKYTLDPVNLPPLVQERIAAASQQLTPFGGTMQHAEGNPALPLVGSRPDPEHQKGV